MNKTIIILVNYNNFTDTIQCVNSLKKLTNKNYEIVIVDNGSQNNSVEEIKKSLPNIKLIETGKNLGFAGANNVAIKYGLENNADFYLLLNNDTIVEPDFLDNMMEIFKNYSKVGIVGSKIMYYGNKKLIWYAGGKVNWLKFRVEHFGLKEIDKGQYDNESEVDFITGCNMLIKKEVLENIGLLEEDYFMYYEDVDFCIKAMMKGYKLIYTPKAVIYHKVSVASGGEDSAFAIKWNTRNKIIFMNKFKKKVKLFSYLVSIAGISVSNIKKWIMYKIKGDYNRASALVEGTIEGIRYIFKN
ncbi:glycosyltransferase family 2 protein [Clostridium sp. SYSU_GA19001]|uniref:glycosyltransferase family 2 protein n=1 Tax=Clostridium caldaquaticum TaxID=2940653 RepID=UPI0020779ABE|nr:glycosyltransferase family 2 protein [Clostridium caldaquaticum]MCM8709411.1 glycosyltransferase family 2 protein [Clostridium caldaquaticum]